MAGLSQDSCKDTSWGCVGKRGGNRAPQVVPHFLEISPAVGAAGAALGLLLQKQVPGKQCPPAHFSACHQGGCPLPSFSSSSLVPTAGPTIGISFFV